ncbi:MAG TPA: flagellar biosynthesis repressor FlbT [Azospirillum sp.]|nr:flagellar biosynthesis repressor FlbT [Azospirillum sp.]
MPLKVNLRAGERIIINGALISVENSIGLTIHNKVNLMLERQLIRPADATTPARRIYFAIQNAYVTEADEQSVWLEQARRYLADYERATTSQQVRSRIEDIRSHLDREDFYPALRLTRELFAHDDRMLSQAPAPQTRA